MQRCTSKVSVSPQNGVEIFGKKWKNIFLFILSFNDLQIHMGLILEYFKIFQKNSILK